MTLDDWLGLTPAARNTERRSWSETEGVWVELLDEALARFNDEHLPHPLINRVSGSATSRGWDMPGILVTTALWQPQLIEELPARYCHFPVVQHPIEDLKDTYLKTWKLVLGQLLHWSEPQVREWARVRYEDDLDGKTDWFYHEDALEYALNELVPTELSRRLRGQQSWFDLRDRVRKAIERHGSRPLWLSPYDWNGARDRINCILGEYETRLPDALDARPSAE